MSEQHLLVWLEAPLQSWGHDSKFGRRDSLDFPTKSGLLGLFCCAMGAGGEQREWLESWASSDMTVEAYSRSDRHGMPVARQPLLSDFHMVGSGYDNQNPWENLSTPKKSDGKNPNGSGSKITHRFYVQDMAYAVIFSAPADQIATVAEALKAPVWDLFLGRKNCAPTEIIFQGVFESHDAAAAQAEKLASSKQRCKSFTVKQGVHEGEVFSLNDIPISFGRKKSYRDRQVTVIKPDSL